jgi:hypothetical protein
MIKDDGGINLISEEVFTKLFLIGEIKEKDLDNIIIRFLQNKDKDKKIGSVNEQEKLNAFKKHLSNFIVNLEERINDHIENLNRVYEKSRDNFIDSFKPIHRISKCEIQRLCGLSKATMLKYKDNFNDQGSKGIQTISFLEWLKIYDPNQYEKFKNSYNKKGG